MTPSPYGTFPKYHPFWYRHPSLKQWFFFQFVHWHGFLRLPQVRLRHSFHHHPEHGLGQYLDLLLKPRYKTFAWNISMSFLLFSRDDVTGRSTGRGSLGHVQHRHLLLLRSAGWIYDNMTWTDLTFFPPNIFDGVTWWDLIFFPPSSMLSWTSWDPMSSDQTCPQKGFVTCHL